MTGRQGWRWCNELASQRFGRLVVLGEAPRRQGCLIVMARCDCGVTREFRYDSLRSGASKSCGCLRREVVSARQRARHPFLSEWVGQKFERLEILGAASSKRGRRVLVRCECGTVKNVELGKLRGGKIRSCGCLAKEVSRERMAEIGRLGGGGHRTHGMSETPIYRAWCRMHGRTRASPSVMDRGGRAKYYSGRGITVCGRWLKFENFAADMGSSWREGLELDRIDTDGDYTPQNCRWVTRTLQMRNTRRNRMVDTPWGRMPLSEAVERAGVDYQQVHGRLRRGWPLERALGQLAAVPEAHRLRNRPEGAT